MHTFALVAGLAGVALGRRWALWPTFAFGGLALVNIVLCPAVGHHQLAGWWYWQLALGVAMVAVPAAALLRTRE